MIPQQTKDELIKYVNGEHPYPFGDFLTAILANDLVGAAQRADDYNIHLLPEYADFLYNKMPGRTGNPMIDFWGSYKAVDNQIVKQRKARV